MSFVCTWRPKYTFEEDHVSTLDLKGGQCMGGGQKLKAWYCVVGFGIIQKGDQEKTRLGQESYGLILVKNE